MTLLSPLPTGDTAEPAEGAPPNEARLRTVPASDDRAPARAEADFLYRKYGVIVYRCCHSLLGNAAAAQDATQEVFIKLLKNIDAFADHQHAIAWAFRVATNHCLNLRRDGAREQALDPELDVVDRAQPASYPDRHLVRSILTRCDAQTRAIAVGVLVEERDHEDVAEALGVSRRTVTRKLQRFLEHARKFAARTDS